MGLCRLQIGWACTADRPAHLQAQSARTGCSAAIMAMPQPTSCRSPSRPSQSGPAALPPPSRCFKCSGRLLPQLHRLWWSAAAELGRGHRKGSRRLLRCGTGLRHRAAAGRAELAGGLQMVYNTSDWHSRSAARLAGCRERGSGRKKIGRALEPRRPRHRNRRDKNEAIEQLPNCQAMRGGDVRAAPRMQTPDPRSAGPDRPAAYLPRTCTTASVALRRRSPPGSPSTQTAATAVCTAAPSAPPQHPPAMQSIAAPHRPPLQQRPGGPAAAARRRPHPRAPPPAAYQQHMGGAATSSSDTDVSDIIHLAKHRMAKKQVAEPQGGLAEFLHKVTGGPPLLAALLVLWGRAAADALGSRRCLCSLVQWLCFRWVLPLTPACFQLCVGTIAQLYGSHGAIVCCRSSWRGASSSRSSRGR